MNRRYKQLLAYLFRESIWWPSHSCQFLVFVPGVDKVQCKLKSMGETKMVAGVPFLTNVFHVERYVLFLQRNWLAQKLNEIEMSVDKVRGLTRDVI
jgi:hypothetical protein